jgi:hypothetical protein
MDLQEVGYEGVDWIKLAQHRVPWEAIVNKVMKLRVSQKEEDFLISSAIISCVELRYQYVIITSKCTAVT